MEDLISVIVPIYRVESYLEQCIQSICSQTYRNLEIILVDDGSDDQCPQICDQYAAEDERIKIIHKKNGGPDSARKAGMLVATGKYVGYVDGDDWIEPQMYEVLLGYILRYDVDVVESGVIDSYDNDERRRVPYIAEGCYKGNDFIEKVEKRILYSGDFFEHGIMPYLVSKLFLKEQIVRYQMKGGMTNTIQDDTMVSLPCIAEAKKIYISHECYYHYRVRRNSLKRECRKDEVSNLFKSYSEFYARFAGTVLCSEKDKQIKYYTMYWLIYKAPYIFDSLYESDFLIPYGGIDKKSKIVLYGAGATGIHLESYMRSVAKSSVVCWVDRNFKELQSTLGVIDPKAIIHYEYDYIVISIMRESAVRSVRQDLTEMGIPQEKILWIAQRYIDNPDVLLKRVYYEGKSLSDIRWEKYE